MEFPSATKASSQSFHEFSARPASLEECVRLVEESLQGFVPDVLQLTKAAEEKDPEVEKEWKRKGNNLYKQKLYLDAITCYNQAACYGSGSSVGLAMANKGQCWSAVGDPSNAIDNINLALEFDYPQQDRYKLYLRRGKQYLALREYSEALKDFEKALKFPGVTKENLSEISRLRDQTQQDLAKTQANSISKPTTSDYIQTINTVLTNASEIRWDQTYGRHIIAKEAIKSGETVIDSEPPYAMALFSSCATERCHTCGRMLLSTIVPCSGCSIARYCNLECREKGISMHEVECKQGLIVTAPTHVLIALRILTKHTLSGDTHTEERALKDARSDFRTVTDLDDHLAEYSLTDLLKYTREAVYWTSLMKNIPKLSTITSTDLLRHILQIRTNAFAITKTREDCGPNKTVTVVSERIGLGLYPISSFINHSCSPNTIVSFDSQLRLTIRAISDIAVGDQIFTNYGPDCKRIPSAEERKRVLREKFFFECNCEECSLPEAMKPQLPQEVIDEICGLVAEGRKLMDAENFKKATATILRARRLCLRNDSLKYHKCLEHATICDLLAHIRVIANNPGKAIEYLEEGLASLKYVYGKNSVEVGNEMFKLCQLLFNTQQSNRALSMIAKTKKILITCYGEGHEDVLELNEMERCIHNFMR